ncbi:hypothetical protein [Streptomyces sp. CB01881]|uniref:hypothetical protein n=1 Tax=Streptomyces sp. CB01881 TaxID=2078691 RepID=UPI000CDBF545|nr:hypothetical protein [Streptomyces sp. CB01881]AUY53688.1 hypothetical protein C2142_38155 [Streptomyces sp. CB01881]TYC68700.1 hypothetical protein EH183_38155 [Streptomyces sp. CB01881]
MRSADPLTADEALAVGVHVRAEFGRLCKQEPHPKDLTATAERLNGARTNPESVRRGMLDLGHAWPMDPLLSESGQPPPPCPTQVPHRRPHGCAIYDGPASDTDFPADLLELQRRWYTAEADWAADPTEEKRAAFTAVGAELYAHPYWGGTDNRHKAAMKLKQAGRPDTAEAPTG